MLSLRRASSPCCAVLLCSASLLHVLFCCVSQVGESVEDANALDDDAQADADDLAGLLEIGGGVAAGGVSGVGGSVEKQKSVPQRKAMPVQKVAYSQMQASAMKQAYQTTVNANNLVRAHTLARDGSAVQRQCISAVDLTPIALCSACRPSHVVMIRCPQVHHAHSLLGLVSRLKLAVLLGESAQDRSRQSAAGGESSTSTVVAAAHPMEAPHPSQIPAHHLPLHLQRAQQQLHQTSLELQAKMNELDRQVEEERWKVDQMRAAAATQ